MISSEYNCPECGCFWDLIICDECGYVGEDFEKVKPKKEFDDSTKVSTRKDTRRGKTRE